MRWLLDQGLPRSAASLLNEASQDAIHVGDIGMAGASDPSILSHALDEGRVIVTLDADFHSLLALNGNARPTVIRIREEGLKGDALAMIILHIVRQFERELEGGCVMSYQRGKIRYRKLPLL